MNLGENLNRKPPKGGFFAGIKSMIEMKSILKNVCLLLLLNLGFQGHAQSNFPTSWLGCYEGEMYLEDINGVNDTIPVQFDLLRTDSLNRWTYRMTYNSRKWGKMVKEYELVWKDSLHPNCFLLDEKDGIFIQEVFMNNRLYSSFEVEGNQFFSLLERKGKNLYFEIRCAASSKGLVSTSEADPNGEKYVVTNFLQYAVQHVLLKPRKVKSR